MILIWCLVQNRRNQPTINKKAWVTAPFVQLDRWFVDRYSLCTLTQELRNPIEDFSCNTISSQLPVKSCMGYSVECLLVIKKHHVHSSSLIDQLRPILKSFQQISLTGSFLHEAMLMGGDAMVIFKVRNNVFPKYAFKYFAALTR